MSIVLPTLIAIGLFALVAILIIGIFAMVKGGEFNKKYGNKLMQARVILQTLIIFALLAIFYSSQN